MEQTQAMTVVIAAGLDTLALQAIASEWMAEMVLDNRAAPDRRLARSLATCLYLSVDDDILGDMLSRLTRQCIDQPVALLVVADVAHVEHVADVAQAACAPMRANIVIRLPTGEIESNASKRAGLFISHPLNCAECQDLADAAAGCMLAGEPLDQSMPGVARHIAQCPACRAELDTLVEVLRQASQEKE